jgi:hypothetical protein
MFSRELHPGDAVIFSTIKRGTHPGPRAKEIRPEPRGEGYLYAIDKFWTVTEAHGGQVALLTRRGKIHIVNADDPHLHRASWWLRLIYRNRFPKLPGRNAQNGRVA